MWNGEKVILPTANANTSIHTQIHISEKHTERDNLRENLANIYTRLCME